MTQLVDAQQVGVCFTSGWLQVRAALRLARPLSAGRVHPRGRMVVEREREIEIRPDEYGCGGERAAKLRQPLMRVLEDR